MSARPGGSDAATASWLGRRDPTVKAVVALVLSGLMLLVTDPVTPAVLYAAALPAVGCAGRIPARTLLRGQAPFLLFGLSLLVVNLLTRDAGPRVSLGPVEVAAEGLAIGLSLALRTLFVGVLTLGFVLTTDGVRLMASLHQHARLPAGITYAVLGAQRLLEGMPDLWRTVRIAHAVRDPRFTGGRLPRSPRALGRAVFTLLVVSLRRGERLAVALETRGLGSGPRTVHRPAALDRRDAVLAVAVLTTFGVVLLIGHIQGWLTGPGRLTGG